jgi:hypothetical protein
MMKKSEFVIRTVKKKKSLQKMFFSWKFFANGRLHFGTSKSQNKTIVFSLFFRQNSIFIFLVEF